MTTQASMEQVAGILVREGLHFQMHEDGDSYRLLLGEHRAEVPGAPGRRFDAGTLIAGIDLLGDDLQASELCNAVYTLAGTVDEVAGALEHRVGGLRYGALLEDELEEAEVEDE